MSEVEVSELAGLERQANRLRFHDRELERTFRDERVVAAQTRSRVLLGAGMLAAAAVGYSETMASDGTAQSIEFDARNLELRFVGMIPAWLVIYFSTGLPGHRRRADWVNTIATLVACWALALIYWHVALIWPRTPIVSAATGGLLTVLLVSAAALPFGFRALAATVTGAIGGTLIFYAATLLPERKEEIYLMLFTFSGIGAVIVFLAWYREAADRLMFAQREYVQRLNKELARLNAEKNEFMAIVSHDLRSPLATVHGLAEQLTVGRLGPSEKVHGAIQELARRMLQLVEDYLGAHAIESGVLPLQMARIDLVAVAREAAARQRPMAELKGQRIVVDAEAPLWAGADASRLAQVVDNFLSNAVKFSPRGAVVRLAFGAADEGGAVRLEVIDEGPGIAPEAQAKLFRKFGRFGTQTTGGETSHGLGLAVAKRLAESMGGTVGCESELGAGATFWVELPAAE